MTDTVTEIMALADYQMESGSIAGMHSNRAFEARAALRAAIERVIAERDGAYELLHRTEDEKREQRERAERAEQRNEEQHRLLVKAEAERDALRALLVEAWEYVDRDLSAANLLARITAALDSPKSPAPNPPAD